MSRGPRSRPLRGSHARTPRRRLAAALAVAVASAVGVGAAVAARAAAPAAGAPGSAAATVACPTVADRLPAVPDRARAEVERNLALLDTQVAEANRRLVTSAGEGGPNFVRNAILGPLEDKRVATINRIATAIGRHGPRPAGLVALAGCTLSASGAPVREPALPAAPAPPAPAPPAPAPPPPAPPAPAPPAPGAPGAATPTVACPGVAGKLPAVPTQARAEVERNLALLGTQVAEANRRLATIAGEGGPNFVRNAILGPLQDKRVATIDRIAIAIGRHAARPQGLDALAACRLVQR